MPVGALLLVTTNIPTQLREQSNGQSFLTMPALAKSNHEMIENHSPPPAEDAGGLEKWPSERRRQEDLDVRSFGSQEACVFLGSHLRCSPHSRPEC
jgi:hypothetical protein